MLSDCSAIRNLKFQLAFHWTLSFHKFSFSFLLSQNRNTFSNCWNKGGALATASAFLRHFNCILTLLHFFCNLLVKCNIHYAATLVLLFTSLYFTLHSFPHSPSLSVVQDLAHIIMIYGCICIKLLIWTDLKYFFPKVSSNFQSEREDKLCRKWN